MTDVNVKIDKIKSKCDVEKVKLSSESKHMQCKRHKLDTDCAADLDISSMENQAIFKHIAIKKPENDDTKSL